ncbi:MAG TPA: tRNA pseudouridine(13) synthase TruD [Steroidobacteraceae bacterium]|nr:tRNA pseudouridine(13) synthase TruD [Steroidobacteraceae bacterium]
MNRLEPGMAPHTEAALNPPRAHGAPLSSGRLRAEPEDFLVEEDLGFEPAGAGQHVLLKVRKRDANTQWIARELARACGCRQADVGYAGLKDRRAVATQWFTVPQSRLLPDDWVGVGSDEYEVLEAHRHNRKLPRGALAGNRFVIKIRGTGVDDAALAGRLAALETRGVPNYFGPQRFGRGGANLKRVSEDMRSLRPPERGFILSAARSLVFNAVLAERVAEGSWERLEPGDLANLDGRASHFRVEALDEVLAERCARLDIHPSGPLWGRGAPPSGGRVLELEQRVAAGLAAECELVSRAGMEQERRSLRLAVRELRWRRDTDAADSVVVEFRLSRGAYATAVLREVFAVDADYDESST